MWYPINLLIALPRHFLLHKSAKQCNFLSQNSISKRNQDTVCATLLSSHTCFNLFIKDAQWIIIAKKSRGSVHFSAFFFFCGVLCFLPESKDAQFIFKSDFKVTTTDVKKVIFIEIKKQKSSKVNDNIWSNFGVSALQMLLPDSYLLDFPRVSKVGSFGEHVLYCLWTPVLLCS